MGVAANTSSGQILVAQRPKDMRTLEQKTQLLKLAKKFCDTHPYIPLEELNRRAKAKADAAKVQSASALLSEQMRTNEKIDGLASMVGTLVQCLPTLLSAPFATSGLHSISLLDSNILSTFRPVSAPLKLRIEESNPRVNDTGFTTETDMEYEPVARQNDGPMLEVGNRLTKEKDGDGKETDEPMREMHSVYEGKKDNVVMADTEDSAEVSAVNSPVGKGIATIKIAHGQLVNFESADICDPRQISFATNIPHLERIWDDEGPNWDPADCGTNLLLINGTPIALRYWPEVFSGKKDARWKALKKNWTEWKFVVERYCSSTADAFWKEFSSADGNPFNWKRICETLRVQRAAHEQHIVDRAKVEYGADFDKIFVNRGKVLTDRTAIARRYFEKHTMDLN
ncbi:uncharacterized protein C8R40DRAFT_1174803 [Lentinula edodes]|uniref:uncharacterized protein n=1 Tax=Lentinula edodes TaxID=5353 RepID=UPI001E8E73D2|nr:uncharacterized protein C8R40DRAFT_1174803 [Lentinula edodes]KAH7871102.1 hypothetical protein C8R40DRAFT_1174803 [Lentinula edodes]